MNAQDRHTKDLFNKIADLRPYMKYSAEIFCAKSRLSPKEADELVQRASLSAMRYLQHGTLDPSKMRGWLSRIVGNEGISYLRKRQKDKRMMETIADLIESVDFSTPYDPADDVLKRVVDRVNEIGGIYVQAFSLRYLGRAVDHIDMDELAARLCDDDYRPVPYKDMPAILGGTKSRSKVLMKRLFERIRHDFSEQEGASTGKKAQEETLPFPQ